jgi:hypothetical protein
MRLARTASSGWQVWQRSGSSLHGMMASNPYRGFRFTAEVIQHAVWLCHRFSLSLREVELILAARVQGSPAPGVSSGQALAVVERSTSVPSVPLDGRRPHCAASTSPQSFG